MAKTIEEFTKRPSTTDQRYVINSIPFPGANQYSRDARRQFYTRRFTGEQRLYLYNINTQEEVNLKLIPDSLSESYSPKVVSVSPFGVITPINFYVGGGPKTLSFSFKMHEDLQNKGGSVYNVIQTLENMIKPVYKNGRLYDPIVYFQLGEQFVGKGHIDTSFTYNKPFKNKRYSMIDVSMTFTFHEEFENDAVELNDGFSSDLSPYSVDSDIVQNYDFVDDFVKFQTDPDYFITQIFGNQKFKTYFNTVFTQVFDVKGDSLNYDYIDAEEAFYDKFQSETINQLTNGNRLEGNAYFDNPYAIDLFNLIFTLREVMFNARSANLDEFLVYFSNLQISVRDLRERYQLSYKTRPSGSAGTVDVVEEGNGWYFTEGASGNSFLIQMTDLEKLYFEDLIDFFEGLIDKQLILYTNLRGASE